MFIKIIYDYRSGKYIDLDEEFMLCSVGDAIIKFHYSSIYS